MAVFDDGHFGADQTSIRFFVTASFFQSYSPNMDGKGHLAKPTKNELDKNVPNFRRIVVKTLLVS